MSEILEALKKNQRPPSAAEERDKIESLTKQVADLRIENTKLKTKQAAKNQETYLKGIMVGQDHILAHLEDGPCGTGCEIDMCIAEYLQKDSFMAFLPYKLKRRKKK